MNFKCNFAASSLAVATLLNAAPAMAQCDDWHPGPEMVYTGFVNTSLVWDPDGNGPLPAKLVVCGGFEKAGWPNGIGALDIAAWDGTTWQALGAGISRDDPRWAPIQAMAVFNGQLVVAGIFTHIGALAANNIASWDGTQWHALGNGLTDPFDPASGVPVFVYSMIVFNGELIVSGAFKTAGSVLVNGMARWNGTSWSPFGDGPAYDVAYRLAIYNNELIAAGFGGSIGGVTANSIARWNGATWAPLGAGLENGNVTALATFNGELVAAGGFDHAGGLPANQIAAWNGTDWHTLGSGITGGTTFHEVESLAIYNNELIAGGDFDHAGSIPAFSVARWNGTSWSAVGSGLGHPPVTGGFVNEAYTLVPFNGKLVAGGSFYSIRQTPVNGLAQWNGTTWEDMQGVIHDVPGAIYAMKQWNGRMVAAGDFRLITSEESYIAYNLVTWDGAKLSESAGSTDAAVWALATVPGQNFSTELIAAGEFTIIGGVNGTPFVSANRIARHTNSFLSSEWLAMGTGFNNTVLAVERMGTVTYAAGAFTTSGNGATTLSHIAQWNGTTWLPLGTGLDGDCYALKTYNGFLYAGGSFTHANGLASGGLARWNGSTWSIVGGNFLGTVYSMEVYNNELVMAGFYPGISGSPNIAKYNGTNYSTLGTGGTNSSVFTLLSEGGNLYAGGAFTIAGGVAANHVARWNGSAWSDVRGGADDRVFALGAFHNEVQAGGRFSSVRNGAIYSPEWARYAETGAPWIVNQPSSQAICGPRNISFTMQPASGYAGLNYQWRKNSVPLADGPTGTGSNITNAHAASLNVGNASAADSGVYDCVLSNTCGSATTIAATLDAFAGHTGDGDANGIVDGRDVAGFEAALYVGGPASVNYCPFDMNGDDVVDMADKPLFIAKLLGF